MRGKLIRVEFRFVPLPEPPLFILRSVTHVSPALQFTRAVMKFSPIHRPRPQC